MNRKRVLRVVGRFAAVLGVTVVVTGVWAKVKTDHQRDARYDVPVEHLVIDDAAEAKAHGEHLVKSLAKCTDCHGDDLGGKVMVSDGKVGTLAGPNITPGGLGKTLTTDDWNRAITHAVGHDGHGLAMMPAKDYSALGKKDVADIIAYARAVPAVTRDTPPTTLGPMLRMLMATGQLDLYHAATLDHSRPLGDSPRPDVNPIYGEYLARAGGCFGCHGPTLAGGAIPGMPPGTPKATDLRPSGPLAKWSEADFEQALRHGYRPDGTMLQEPMPWRATAQMTDTEMKALYVFLKQPTNRAELSQR